jgi:hypothetical protein
MNAIAKIYQLLYTREIEHVELAVQLAKSINIDLLAPYRELTKILNETDVKLFPYDPQEDELKQLHVLLFIREASFGYGLYHRHAPYSYAEANKRLRCYNAQLPKELIYLHFLKILKVYNPKLQSLPEDIDRLKFLHQLVVHQGKIRKLPARLFNLEHLNTLCISSNELECIPKEIAQLQKLSRLNLSANCLQSLPEEMSMLKNLEYLYLEGNCLTSVPDFIYQLPMLIDLNLEENFIPKTELKKVYTFVEQNARRIALEQMYESYRDYYAAISSTKESDLATIQDLAGFSPIGKQEGPFMVRADIPLPKEEDSITYEDIDRFL